MKAWHWLLIAFVAFALLWFDYNVLNIGLRKFSDKVFGP